MRTILVAIFDTANSLHEEAFAIRSTDALNLTSAQGVGLTKMAGEQAINQFIREGWLERSRAGFLSLSERGLLELREYLEETFNEVEEDEEGNEDARQTDKIRKCHTCSEILTKVTNHVPIPLFSMQLRWMLLSLRLIE